MAFDIETAKPVQEEQTSKFDLKSAQEVEDDSHDASEWSPPATTKEGYKKTPAALRMEKLMHDTEEERKQGKSSFMKGVGEAALTLGSRAYHAVKGGYKGLWTLGTGGGLDKAVSNIEAEEKKAYVPKTATGKLLMNVNDELSQIPGEVSAAGAGGVAEKLGASPQTVSQVEDVARVAPNIAMAASGLRKPGASVAKGVAESVGKAAKKVSDRIAGVEPAKTAPIDSRGAKMLRDAMEGMTPEDLKAAQAELDKAREAGVNLTGPEAFKDAPKLHDLMMKSDKSSNIISNFIKNRPEQAKAAIQGKLKEIGEDVGKQEAASAVEEGATDILKREEKERTAEVSPHYEAQKTSDAEALGLMDDIEKTQKQIAAGEVWKNDAVQQAGRWYAFSHQMGLKANEVANKVREWVTTDAEEAKALQRLEEESGNIDINKEKTELYTDRAKEGKAATYEAVQEAQRRRAFIEDWRKDLAAGQDALAAKNLPEIQGKVQNLLKDLDAKIRLAGDTPSGKILKQFRDQIAPEGKPVVLPSQLEDIHKANKAKLDLGLAATAEERTAAGVLKNPVGQLDSLIRDISPDIAKGRELYENISKYHIDPLYKGPLGKLAGKGADAMKEPSVSRIFSELESDTATPDRIRSIADQLNKYDPQLFPNYVRAYLEDAWNKAQSEKGGATDRTAGQKFTDAISANPAQRARLATMVQKVAEAQGQGAREAHLAALGFNNLMDVLRNAGRFEDLGRQGTVEASQALAKSAISAVRPKGYGVRTAAEALSDWWYKGAYENLSKIMTDPNAISKMQELAKIPAEKKEARMAMARNILGFTEQNAKDITKGVAAQELGQENKEGQ